MLDTNTSKEEIRIGYSYNNEIYWHRYETGKYFNNFIEKWTPYVNEDYETNEFNKDYKYDIANTLQYDLCNSDKKNKIIGKYYKIENSKDESTLFDFETDEVVKVKDYDYNLKKFTVSKVLIFNNETQYIQEISEQYINVEDFTVNNVKLLDDWHSIKKKIYKLSETKEISLSSIDQWTTKTRGKIHYVSIKNKKDGIHSGTNEYFKIDTVNNRKYLMTIDSGNEKRIGYQVGNNINWIKYDNQEFVEFWIPFKNDKRKTLSFHSCFRNDIEKSMSTNYNKNFQFYYKIIYNPNDELQLKQEDIIKVKQHAANNYFTLEVQNIAYTNSNNIPIFKTNFTEKNYQLIDNIEDIKMAKREIQMKIKLCSAEIFQIKVILELFETKFTDLKKFPKILNDIKKKCYKTNQDEIDAIDIKTLEDLAYADELTEIISVNSSAYARSSNVLMSIASISS
jgi:hypothetical protein